MIYDYYYIMPSYAISADIVVPAGIVVVDDALAETAVVWLLLTNFRRTTQPLATVSNAFP